MWRYCWDMKKSSLNPGIFLNVGTLNRGFTVVIRIDTIVSDHAS
jgi:hypothetical protein